MARIRKIPDTWTLEIHAIVLKDSRQAEHEEIGCMNTTRRSSVYSNTKRGGRRGQQKETRETKRPHKTKLSIREHQIWWERSSKERNARNKTIRQDDAQYTRTPNVVGEEVKTKRRRCPEERKIKRLNHHGQTASTYGSLLRPERN